MRRVSTYKRTSAGMSRKLWYYIISIGSGFTSVSFSLSETPVPGTCKRKAQSEEGCCAAFGTVAGNGIDITSGLGIFSCRHVLYGPGSLQHQGWIPGDPSDRKFPEAPAFGARHTVGIPVDICPWFRSRNRRTSDWHIAYPSLVIMGRAGCRGTQLLCFVWR